MKPPAAGRRRVCVVVTARPSYSRIRSALRAIQARPDLELCLVVAASALLDRYGSVVEQIEADGFEIAERVFMVLEGENPTSMAKTTGLGVMELATSFLNLRPDVVVTVADRYETMATAVAAAYMNLPLAHVQGGEVTGSIDEKVRHAITKLADVHLVASEDARRRVLRLGEREDAVHVTGCPSIDVAAALRDDPPARPLRPYEHYTGVGGRPELGNGYLVVMQHPVTTEHERARAQVEETLGAVADAAAERDLAVLWFWPNVDAGANGTSAGIRSFRETHAAERFHFFKNMSPVDFLRLLTGSRCLVGNSSVGIRECAFLGVPVVDIGARQAGRQRGRNAVHAPHERAAIARAVCAQAAHGPYAPDPIYGDGHAGERIAEALATCPLGVEKRITF